MSRPRRAVLFLLLGLLASCGSGTGPAVPGPWAGWQRLPLEHAHYFQLWARGPQRLLITFGPGGEQDTTGMLGMGPAGSGFPAGAVPLQEPVRRTALSSTTQSAFLQVLGLAGTVAGCAHADRLQDPGLLERVATGGIMELADGNGLDRERLTALAPQVLFSDPYTAAAGMPLGRTMPQCVVSEYLEPHPLGRAEWIKAVGAVMGLPQRADSLYRAMAGRYRAAAASVPEGGHRPKVFFGSSWQGVWSVPGGNSYMARLLRDAGADYLFGEGMGQGNRDLDMETVLARGVEAEWWGRILYLARPVAMEDLAGDEDRVLALPVFRAGRGFYANSAESDLFGQAVLEPDVVLLDLIGIFSPELRGQRGPVYFKPVQ
jgi:iron complex transport system substrate-binding protein